MSRQDKNTTNVVFVLRLKELMDKNGLTQNELSKVTSITQSTISSYLVGRTSPKSAELSRLADYFDIPMDYLWGRINNPLDTTNPIPDSMWAQRALDAEKKLSKLQGLIDNLSSDVKNLGVSVSILSRYISE